MAAVLEKAFFDAYCLGSESTSLFPERLGSIRNRALSERPRKVCSLVICAYFLSGAEVLTVGVVLGLEDHVLF